MSENAKIVLVGCGNMGFAMLVGWLENGIARPEDVWVVEPVDVLRDRAETKGVHAVSEHAELPSDIKTNLLIIAVKPQQMSTVLPDYAGLVAGSGAVVVSVAAGVPISRFEAEYGASASVIRVMPNTPSAIGQGMMVICPNENASDEQLELVDKLMEASGKTARISDEGLMDAVTAVSGSGPAYLFHMIEALREAAMSVGLPSELAHTLAMQTIVGSANYAAGSADDASTLREQVTSPNGTTAAALAVLMDTEAGLASLVGRAVAAARDRSVELGS